MIEKPLTVLFQSRSYEITHQVFVVCVTSTRTYSARNFGDVLKISFVRLFSWQLSKIWLIVFDKNDVTLKCNKNVTYLEKRFDYYDSLIVHSMIMYWQWCCCMHSIRTFEMQNPYLWNPAAISCLFSDLFRSKMSELTILWLCIVLKLQIHNQ